MFRSSYEVLRFWVLPADCLHVAAPSLNMRGDIMSSSVCGNVPVVALFCFEPRGNSRKPGEFLALIPPVPAAPRAPEPLWSGPDGASHIIFWPLWFPRKSEQQWKTCCPLSQRDESKNTINSCETSGKKAEFWPSIVAKMASPAPTNDTVAFFFWYLGGIHHSNHQPRPQAARLAER